MKHRKLRIAWSVAWRIGTVLLVVLWVRSHHSELMAFRLGPSSYSAFTFSKGWLHYYGSRVPPKPVTAIEWEFDSRHDLDLPTGIQWRITSSSQSVAIPIWVPAVIAGSLAGAPWLPLLGRLRRFSLRTLLIATTLVAVGLGLIVWLR